jgi:sterol desaturase/sphingolipid hydroxylase (fatty acid hydroxylase superfamily)
MDPLKIFLIFAMVAVLFAMLSAEKMRPARPFPFYRGWIGIGLGVMVVFVALANGWSVVIPSNWLREHRLLHGEVLGTGGSIVVWYVFNTFVGYWYHRLQHRSSLAWRMLHQVHHGVPRVDIPSALVAHPLDVIVSTTLSILVSAFFLGLNLRVVAIVNALQFFLSLFPHWNVQTPKWVGYFIQRPEEHILHHQRGVHSGNYSDWPFWDKLFGTYRCPVDEPVPVGYERAGLAEQLKMLAFIDVNSPNYRDQGNMPVLEMR